MGLRRKSPAKLATGALVDAANARCRMSRTDCDEDPDQLTVEAHGEPVACHVTRRRREAPSDG